MQKVIVYWEFCSPKGGHDCPTQSDIMSYITLTLSLWSYHSNSISSYITLVYLIEFVCWCLAQKYLFRRHGKVFYVELSLCDIFCPIVRRSLVIDMTVTIPVCKP